MAAPSDLFDPRRQPRRPAGGMDARAPEGWECLPLKLIEISSTGIRATAEDRVAPGAVIRVRMPAFDWIDVRVTATDGSELHGEFCGPADLRRLFLTRFFVGWTSSFERRCD